MKRLAYAFVAVGLVTSGTPALAQDLPTTETIHLDLSRYLEPGSRVRISGHSLRRVGGYVVGLQTNTILVGDEKHVAPEAARPIKLAAVDTLWTAGNWMWQGIALGSSVGGLVGGAICVFGQADECIAFPVAIASGVVVGGAVGLVRKVWYRRFIRRDGGPVPTLGPWNQR